MKRASRSALLAAVLLACAGCARSPAPVDRQVAPVDVEVDTASADRTSLARPHPRLAPRAPRALNAPRLPEDPEAGARSTAQWRERRATKMRMRQQLFDRATMPVHDELLAAIAGLRERYDRASDEAALTAARTASAAQLARIEKGLAELDAWGTGSRLLADYAALHEALASSYPEAKRSSLRGDDGALRAAQSSFEQRLQGMRVWLDEAKTAPIEVPAAKTEHASATSRR